MVPGRQDEVALGLPVACEQVTMCSQRKYLRWLLEDRAACQRGNPCAWILPRSSTDTHVCVHLSSQEKPANGPLIRPQERGARGLFRV